MGKTSAKLYCHVMHDLVNEIGIAKCKVYSQEFSWRKRMYPIDKDAIAWKDKKGISHLFIDVNESDGTIRFLSPQKLNLLSGEVCKLCNSPVPIDLCGKCGDRISYDARNVRDLLKRKTIDTFWGLDSSHIILLMLMGIVAIAGIGASMYLIGQNTKLQEQLNKYLPTAEEVKASKMVTNAPATTTTPKLILGELLVQ